VARVRIARLLVPAFVLSGLLLSAGVASAEAPFNSQAPSITGPNPPAVGSVLQGNNGSWLYADGSSCGSDCSYTFEFSHCPAGASSDCTVVKADSADRDYTVQGGDVGFSILLAVTAHKYDCNANGVDCRWVTRTAKSSPTGPVGGSAAAVLAISPSALPAAVAGTGYSQTLSASGGSGPYTFSISGGALPSGLSLSSSGAITGTATQAGTFAFTVRATGSTNASGTQAFTLRVELALAAGPLADGVTGVAYTQQLNVAAGGAPPFSFRVVDGALPPGLALAPSGAVTGMPTQAGSFTFAAEATDARGATGRLGYSVKIGWPTLAFTTEVRPAISDRPYRQRLAVSGGSAPYAWTLEEGAVLPPGLTLRRDGVLLGTPSARAGSFSFVVAASDRFGAPGSTRLTLELRPALILIRPTSLAPATVGRAYSAALRAGGGKAPYLFSRAGGRLPAGLKLTAAGRLVGRPRVGGVFRFGIRALDANGAAKTRAYVLVVRAR
jgi:large repetitive protein